MAISKRQQLDSEGAVEQACSMVPINDVGQLTRTILVVSIVTTITLSCSGASTMGRGDESPTRISFEQGLIYGRVRGQLDAGQDEHWFVLDAQGGQHMVVNIAPGGGTETANAVTITSPSGKQEGGKGGVVYDRTLPETGTYRIRVARNLMATHGGVAGFTLEVVIYSPLPT